MKNVQGLNFSWRACSGKVLTAVRFNYHCRESLKNSFDLHLRILFLLLWYGRGTKKLLVFKKDYRVSKCYSSATARLSHTISSIHGQILLYVCSCMFLSNYRALWCILYHYFAHKQWKGPKFCVKQYVSKVKYCFCYTLYSTLIK